MEKITFFNLLIYIDFKTAFEKLSTRGNIADISSTTEINKHTFCNFSIFIKFNIKITDVFIEDKTVNF